MNRVLTTAGLILTVIYTAGMLLILNGRMGQLFTMPLNEIGDFFAGIFGPVAFLWLILGFLQQGKELQQSTKALELQATELNNSVEQQRKLVKVTKDQVEAQREASQVEKKLQLKAAEPNFIFQGVHANGSVDQWTYKINIKNTGNTVTKVSISSDVKLKSISPSELPVWERNQSIHIDFMFDGGGTPDTSIFTINYTDESGSEGKSQYKFSKKQGESLIPELDIDKIYS